SHCKTFDGGPIETGKTGGGGPDYLADVYRGTIRAAPDVAGRVPPRPSRRSKGPVTGRGRDGRTRRGGCAAATGGRPTAARRDAAAGGRASRRTSQRR